MDNTISKVTWSNKTPKSAITMDITQHISVAILLLGYFEVSSPSMFSFMK